MLLTLSTDAFNLYKAARSLERIERTDNPFVKMELDTVGPALPFGKDTSDLIKVELQIS